MMGSMQRNVNLSQNKSVIMGAKVSHGGVSKNKRSYLPQPAVHKENHTEELLQQYINKTKGAKKV